MIAADFLVSEFHESPIPEGSPRFVSCTCDPGKPGVVIGMRRTGKTDLTYERMRELTSSSVDQRDLSYADFEDDPHGPRPP